jgi:thiol-disulfide isomerase/thioredoxin
MDKIQSAFGLVFGLLFIFGLNSCWSDQDKNVKVMTFQEFDPYLKKSNDTVYIINFWTTWCKPCIKELPDFEKINDDYSKKKVKVYLVSLDFPDKHDELLIPFIKEHNIHSEVIHLTDTDANSWIDKVSPFWSGSIPVTVIYKGTSREFYEKTLTYDELKKIIDSQILK